jgi:hypothetical protein
MPISANVASYYYLGVCPSAGTNQHIGARNNDPDVVRFYDIENGRDEDFDFCS